MVIKIFTQPISCHFRLCVFLSICMNPPLNGARKSPAAQSKDDDEGQDEDELEDGDEDEDEDQDENEDEDEDEDDRNHIHKDHHKDN